MQALVDQLGEFQDRFYGRMKACAELQIMQHWCDVVEFVSVHD